jgi:hypothetical protein
MSHSQLWTRRTKNIFLHDGDKRHLDNCSNHDNIDYNTIGTYPYGVSECVTITYQDRSLSSWITTDMTSKEIAHDTKVENHHESETVLQTVEDSHNGGQLLRFSQRILAASASSLPIFERSPAPSPPPSEERNTFQEEQRTKGGTATPQNPQNNKEQPR